MEIKDITLGLKNKWDRFRASEFYIQTFGWALALIKDLATRKDIPNPEADWEREEDKLLERKNSYEHANDVRRRDDALKGNL
jgi:hypothetical protein